MEFALVVDQQVGALNVEQGVQHARVAHGRAQPFERGRGVERGIKPNFEKNCPQCGGGLSGGQFLLQEVSAIEIAQQRNGIQDAGRREPIPLKNGGGRFSFGFLLGRQVDFRPIPKG